MKLAMRPKNRPIGAKAQARSAIGSKARRRLWQNSQTAITTPSSKARRERGIKVSWPRSRTSPNPATSMAEAAAPKKILRKRAIVIRGLAKSGGQ